MEAVASRSGVSNGTLYSRYPSEDALFRSVVQRHIDHWHKHASSEDHLIGEDISERLHHFGRTLVWAITDEEIGGFSKFLLVQANRFPEMARALHGLGYRRFVNFIAGEIEAAAVRDANPVVDAIGVSQHLISAVVGWHMQQSIRGTAPIADTLAFTERNLDLVLVARHSW